MTIKIPLQIDGVDLSSDTVLANMDPELDEVDWVTHGPITLAIVYSEETSPRAAVAEAHDWVLRIHKLLAGATVTGVFDELVGWNEVAARCSVTPEAVRTWAKGLRRGQARAFPSARQAVPLGAGKRSLYLYAWREVLIWVRDVIGLDPDEGMTYLDDGHIAEINACIASERGMTVPGEFTPLSKHLLPSSGQLEAKLENHLEPWTQMLEVTRASSRQDWSEVEPLLLQLGELPSQVARQEMFQFGTRLTSLHWSTGTHTSLA
jgi:hypothetical protein